MASLETIVGFLLDREIKLATAESCTAGLVVSELARIPGSGQAIDCGLAVYSPQAKDRYLCVGYDLIERHGLTSEAVAEAMARGAIDNNDAHLAIANTGVAGPAPGPGGLSPGTVCMAWTVRTDDGVVCFTETRVFEGDRNEVRARAAHYCLERVMDYYPRAVQGQ